MKEIWKSIEGYEGLYEVSNMGRVKSLHYEKEKIIKQRKNNGYFEVKLYKNKIHKDIKVHRLVALAFISNPNNYPCVNHKDENKANNNVSNLEWCTYKYNLNYGSIIKRKSTPVLCIETNTIYQSGIEIERQLGFNRSSIYRCCYGKQKTCGGYHWEFV